MRVFESSDLREVGGAVFHRAVEGPAVEVLGLRLFELVIGAF